MKQSRMCPRKVTGLLRCARNDEEATVLTLPPHPVPRRRMRRAKPGAARTEKLLPQRTLRIFRLVPATPGQLRHQHVGDILEIAGGDRKRNVEAVDVGRLAPLLDL